MIRIITAVLAAVLITAALPPSLSAQSIDPVISETVPRQIVPLEPGDPLGVTLIDQALAAYCHQQPCRFTASDPAEIMGSMCWNDDELGQTFCRDAVVGQSVEVCHHTVDPAYANCFSHDTMDGEVSEALRDDPALTLPNRSLTWQSEPNTLIARDEIGQSDYCANPPEGACTRVYNIGEIRWQTCEDGQCVGGREGWIFEHCWDVADTGLAQCRQAIITPGEDAG